MLGNVETSFSWRGGSISAALITFNTFHPWLKGLKEEDEHPGFFKVEKVEKGSYRNITDFDNIGERNIIDSKNKKTKQKLFESISNSSGDIDNRVIEIIVSTPNKLRVLPDISNRIQGLGSLPFLRQCNSLPSSTILSYYCSYNNNNNSENDGNDRNSIKNHINCDELFHSHRSSRLWIEGNFSGSIKYYNFNSYF